MVAERRRREEGPWGSWDLIGKSWRVFRPNLFAILHLRLANGGAHRSDHMRRTLVCPVRSAWRSGDDLASRLQLNFCSFILSKKIGSANHSIWKDWGRENSPIFQQLPDKRLETSVSVGRRNEIARKYFGNMTPHKCCPGNNLRHEGFLASYEPFVRSLFFNGVEVTRLVDFCIEVQGVLGCLRRLGPHNSRSHLTLSTQSSMYIVASAHQLCDSHGGKLNW